MTSTVSDGPPRSALVAAVVLAVGAVVATLVVAAVTQRKHGPAPVAVSAVPAPGADGPDCARLVGSLPDQLGDYWRAPLVEPAPAGAAAWQRDDAGEAVVLRCGVERPADFVVGAPLTVVDAVSWFRVQDTAQPDQDADRATWFAVDRPVYVALTLPPGSGPDAIQTVSTAVAAALPARPVDPGPAR
ncbi:DUF3515 domain-containing protein [Mycolicibacterium sp. 018/SC-01/001]|uniref:DUF3515 domain-containing protein n=1 Tax=Mycolicibacterium sp. 018/SC-01/001 TaxID=2592069 RepID=UPI00117DF5CA|nr:DUF3515 domain-containing protein [Mycolicibacterium sp. 018/SC-01/001]TRW81411.1 DUF3515 domain-containing protein [Mycolicibacterium sp. 018/SC-01/001]